MSHFDTRWLLIVLVLGAPAFGDEFPSWPECFRDTHDFHCDRQPPAPEGKAPETAVAGPTGKQPAPVRTQRAAPVWDVGHSAGVWRPQISGPFQVIGPGDYKRTNDVVSSEAPPLDLAPHQLTLQPYETEHLVGGVSSCANGTMERFNGCSDSTDFQFVYAEAVHPWQSESGTYVGAACTKSDHGQLIGQDMVPFINENFSACVGKAWGQPIRPRGILYHDGILPSEEHCRANAHSRHNTGKAIDVLALYVDNGKGDFDKFIYADYFACKTHGREHPVAACEEATRTCAAVDARLRRSKPTAGDTSEIARYRDDEKLAAETTAKWCSLARSKCEESWNQCPRVIAFFDKLRECWGDSVIDLMTSSDCSMNENSDRDPGTVAAGYPAGTIGIEDSRHHGHLHLELPNCRGQIKVKAKVQKPKNFSLLELLLGAPAYADENGSDEGTPVIRTRARSTALPGGVGRLIQRDSGGEPASVDYYLTVQAKCDASGTYRNLAKELPSCEVDGFSYDPNSSAIVLRYRTSGLVGGRLACVNQHTVKYPLTCK